MAKELVESDRERMRGQQCVRSFIEAIHSDPTHAVIYVSGGASQALGWLMSVPGASNTVLEAVVPYSRHSMAQLLGKIPSSFTSQQTAEEMALAAYNRALMLSTQGRPVVGVGFTGALASTYPKRGSHRFYVSTRTATRLWTCNLTLMKGFRNREEEDKISSHFLLKGIAEACKITIADSCIPELHESELPEENEAIFDEHQELQQLIDGKICMKVYPFGFDEFACKSERIILLSGSFNPLHDGHLRLLDVASSIVGDGFPCFEISAVNADKPPLTVAQIKDRVEQFRKVGKSVIISNQPYFYKKAGLFPGAAFVIGADTAARLIDPKYYGGDPKNMMEMLDACKRSGCLFVVGARLINGVLKVLEDFDIPEVIKDMFISIPEASFRMDVSSTEIRKSERISH